MVVVRLVFNNSFKITFLKLKSNHFIYNLDGKTLEISWLPCEANNLTSYSRISNKKKVDVKLFDCERTCQVSLHIYTDFIIKFTIRFLLPMYIVVYVSLILELNYVSCQAFIYVSFSHTVESQLYLEFCSSRFHRYRIPAAASVCRLHFNTNNSIVLNPLY